MGEPAVAVARLAGDGALVLAAPQSCGDPECVCQPVQWHGVDPCFPAVSGSILCCEVSNQWELAAVAGCGGGGFAADSHPPSIPQLSQCPFSEGA